MEYHRISFIHDDTEYSFIKAMNERLTGHALVSACRMEVQIYMKEHKKIKRIIDVQDILNNEPEGGAFWGKSLIISCAPKGLYQFFLKDE